MHAARVVLAGPTLEPSGAQMNGTLLVVEVNSIDAVTRLVASLRRRIVGQRHVS